MIVDILTTILVAGEMEFTASSAALEVPVTPIVGVPIPFANGQNRQWFVRGDNVKVTRLWVTIPFGFGQGTGLPLARPFWLDSTSVPWEIPELAGFSYLPIPDVCKGIDFGDGLFLEAIKEGVPVVAAGGMALGLADFALNVSQVGLPVALDGQVISVRVHLMVEHTIPMTAAP